MTTSERTAYFNQHGEEAAKKYGFKIATSVNEEHGAYSRRVSL
jgi:hypothetical protein